MTSGANIYRRLRSDSGLGRGLSCAGFTLLELLVVIIIISTLAAVLLDRLTFYQEAAEKAAMEQMVGNLRSALHMQIADKLVRGKTGDIAKLPDDNPMEWLAEQPSNYIGVRFAPPAKDVSGGNWYFDLKDKSLVYAVKRGEHFVANSAGRKEVRYKARLIYSRDTTDKRDNAEEKEINGVILALVEPYQWF